jgi:hypothetical protein
MELGLKGKVALVAGASKLKKLKGAGLDLS